MIRIRSVLIFSPGLVLAVQLECPLNFLLSLVLANVLVQDLLKTPGVPKWPSKYSLDIGIKNVLTIYHEKELLQVFEWLHLHLNDILKQDGKM